MPGKTLRQSMKQQYSCQSQYLCWERQSAVEVKPETLLLHHVSTMLAQKKGKQAWCAYTSLCKLKKSWVL